MSIALAMWTMTCVRTEFLSPYEWPETTGIVLAKGIEDMLLRLQLYSSRSSSRPDMMARVMCLASTRDANLRSH